MSEWQPIETAPKDGTQILLYCNYYSSSNIEIGSFRNDDNDKEGEEKGWFDNSYDDFSCGYASTPLAPTHWMPLPDPPQLDEAD